MPDGNVIAQETNDFGAGIPPASQSGTRGAWRRTGRRSLEYTILEFNYDADGNYISTLVIHVTADIDKSFDTWHLKGSLEVFDAGQDPLDPYATPFVMADVAPFTARRIPVGL